MNGHVYLEWLSGKFGFGEISFFSHKNPLAALMLLLKLNLGLRTFKMHNQLLVSVKVIRSSKMLDGKLPLNLFFKLNADGSRLNNGLASAGGLVRDCSGKW